MPSHMRVFRYLRFKNPYYRPATAVVGVEAWHRAAPGACTEVSNVWLRVVIIKDNFGQLLHPDQHKLGALASLLFDPNSCINIGQALRATSPWRRAGPGLRP